MCALSEACLCILLCPARAFSTVCLALCAAGGSLIKLIYFKMDDELAHHSGGAGRAARGGGC